MQRSNKVLKMGKILHRYILNELAGPFALSLGVFLFVLLMGRLLQIVDLIVRQGVSPLILLKLFLILIPPFLPFAIPMATLISGVVCFSRLTSDLEITALRASGIGLLQLLPPVALLSTLTALLTLFMTLYGAPWGSFTFRVLALKMAQEHLTVAFKPGVFNAPFRDFLLYAERISQDRQGMEGIFIQDSRSAEVSLQILARRGRILWANDDPDLLTLLLEEGTILQVNPEKEALRRIRFRQYEVNLNLALTRAQQEIQRGRRKEMDTAQLLRKIHKLTRKGKPADQYLVEFHRRLSIPVTCLLFGLLSLPLALQSRPQGRSHGFLLGTLTIVIYYMIFTTGLTLAESGRLPFWIPLWTPNLLLTGFTLVLLWRTAHERPSRLLVLLNAGIDHVQRWLSTVTRGSGGAP